MKRIYTSVVALVAFAAASATADAGLVLNLNQAAGSTVVFSYSGSIDTTGFTPFGSAPVVSEMTPSTGVLSIDGPSNWFTAPTTIGGAFGSGANARAASSSGNAIRVFGGNLFALPIGYTSGSAISGTATYNGTFASLGITPSQSYTYSWGGGSAGKFVTLNVGPSAVPEIDPAGLGSVLALVTGALGLLERRRKLSA
jgi:hypothetical protein